MERNKTRLWIYGLLTLAIMGLIFFMSAKDATESGGMSKWLVNTEIDLRKYAHMAEYAALAVSSALFFRELLLEKRYPVRAVGCSLVFSVLYACSDEYHQTFVPGRSGEIRDVFVDLAGVLFGLVLVFLVCMSRKELK